MSLWKWLSVCIINSCQVHKTAISWCIACYGVYIFIREVVLNTLMVYHQETYCLVADIRTAVFSTEIFLMVFLNVIFCSISVVALRRDPVVSESEIVESRSGTTRGNRHATITTIILSSLFSFFNIIGFSFLILYTVSGALKIVPDACHRSDYELFHVMDNYLNDNNLLAINSALNPIVYFARKNDFRLFLKKLRMKLIHLFGRRKNDKSYINDVKQCAAWKSF